MDIAAPNQATTGAAPAAPAVRKRLPAKKLAIIAVISALAVGCLLVGLGNVFLKVDGEATTIRLGQVGRVWGSDIAIRIVELHPGCPTDMVSPECGGTGSVDYSVTTGGKTQTIMKDGWFYSDKYAIRGTSGGYMNRASFSVTSRLDCAGQTGVQDDCWLTNAVNFQDAASCARISTQDKRDGCIENIVEFDPVGQWAACGQVVNPKSSCGGYAAVKQSKDDICATMMNNYYQDLCRREFQKKGPILDLPGDNGIDLGTPPNYQLGL